MYFLIQNYYISDPLEWTWTDKYGRTGFMIAQDCGKTKIVNLIKEKLPSLAF